MSTRPYKFAVATLVVGSLGVGSQAWADHCNYTQQVTRGTHDVCEMPTSAAECEVIGTRDTVRDPEFAQGACPATDVVGTCDKGTTQIVYYTGDPEKLKVGCGFQGGTWLNGYASP